jgi:DNA replication licensing factor MCM3
MIEKAQESAMDGKESAVRFPLNLDLLRIEHSELAQSVLDKPLTYYKAALEALQIVCREEAGEGDQDGLEYFLGVSGSFGPNSVSPRGLRARLLGKLVSVEGIVTKMGTVKPKLVELVQYCKKTNVLSRRAYRDGTDLDGLPTTSVIPTRDELDNLLEMEFGPTKCAFF